MSTDPDEIGCCPKKLTLDDVIITGELTSRPARRRNGFAQKQAFEVLMHEMAKPAGNTMQALIETALQVCAAQSAGMSLIESVGTQQQFRWYAVAGKWSRFLGGTMRRDLSPCGTVLDRNCPILMSRPHLHYPLPPEAIPTISEVLLLPFHVGHKAVGTLWVITHDDTVSFDGEDLRVLADLARYAADAYIVHSMEELKADLDARLGSNSGN